MSVLVTYATSLGSTKEIAERIAQRLAPLVRPAAVDCLEVSAVPPLADTGSSGDSNYAAIVVGSAIHAGRWLPPARAFLQRNRRVLVSSPSAPPVWAFSVGMPADEEARAAEEASVNRALREQFLPPESSPGSPGGALRGHRLFRGRFERADAPWWMGLFLCCIPRKAQLWGDMRDWEEIEAWADWVGGEMREAGVGRV
ncbi:hypothetical protein NKR23_g2203 [Pleurostoma richardsiae]|uniref:Flavodoxin domain-containing protein n=1 Tax=Pleurostoma richardsiae TaxID=41990 RepID=A0AA38S835_9PEZI|nr:hypothetical protein NKR23_g2203 [Pleurostoma richardsiae]